MLTTRKNILANLLILALLVVVVVFFWRTWLSFKKVQPTTKMSDQYVNSDLTTLQIFPQDPVLGAISPELTIVLFSDFECPYCADSFPILEQFTNTHLNKVKLVWKDAIANNHEQAVLAAQAAHCANSQGQFWPYARMLFRNQEQITRLFLLNLAKNLNLDQNKFQTCLEENQTKPLVDFNQQQVSALGIKETPTIFIDGLLYNGDVSSSVLEQFLVK